LDRDAAAFGAPFGATLDQFDREPLVVERSRQCKSGETAADNENCLDRGHIFSDTGARIWMRLAHRLGGRTRE
jgi:hypothetical protein